MAYWLRAWLAVALIVELHGAFSLFLGSKSGFLFAKHDSCPLLGGTKIHVFRVHTERSITGP